MYFRLSIYFIILLTLISVFSSNGQVFRTVGYLPVYRFNTLSKIELEKLTHLNIAFANPDLLGNLTTEGVSISGVVENAHQSNVKVYIALAGAGAKLADWEKWLKPANRPAFISKIIVYLTQHKLQGVDVDLEWGNVNNDYSGFVIELKDSLLKHGFGLSAALPGTYRYPEISDSALAAFDWVNIMAYDLTGPWEPGKPGPHSPFSFAETSVNFWIGHGLEKNRLNLGVPFYGYNFASKEIVTALSYAQIVGMNPNNANLDQAGQIYYNGLPTIEKKTRLALNNTGGIMIWELGQDHFGEYSLLKRINETIEKFYLNTAEEKTSSFVNIFPNPAGDFVYLQFADGVSENVKVTLLSPDLRILSVQQNNFTNVFCFKTNQFNPGLYFLLIEKNEFREFRKIVIQ
jgi:chitinase